MFMNPQAAAIFLSRPITERLVRRLRFELGFGLLCEKSAVWDLALNTMNYGLIYLPNLNS